MMARKQTMKYENSEIREAFRTINLELAAAGSGGGSNVRLAEDDASSVSVQPAQGVAPDGQIHVETLVRALQTTGANPLDEAEAREYAAFFQPDARGMINWDHWVEKFLETSS